MHFVSSTLFCLKVIVFSFIAIRVYQMYSVHFQELTKPIIQSGAAYKMSSVEKKENRESSKKIMGKDAEATRSWKCVWSSIKPGKRIWNSSCPTPHHYTSQSSASFDKIELKGSHLQIAPNLSSCVRKEYFASPWEEYWTSEIGNIADYGGFPLTHFDNHSTPGVGWDCGCKHMQAAAPEVDVWIKIWKERDNLGANAVAVPWSKEIFSYHKIFDDCAPIGKRILGLIPIEPLVGLLRHPHHHCFRNALADKDYMFLFSKSEVVPSLTAGENNAFLFDLGASLYNSGFGGASQSWFVDSYAARDIHFDRIFAWEAIVHAPKDIYKSVPYDLISKLSYYNVEADPSPLSKLNPLSVLKEVAGVGDFVVIKIDIDDSSVEAAFIQQILIEKDVHSLIDELYYEHHASGSPLHWTAWLDTVGEATIDESYSNFTALRNLGIRAHSWV